MIPFAKIKGSHKKNIFFSSDICEWEQDIFAYHLQKRKKINIQKFIAPLIDVILLDLIIFWNKAFTSSVPK